MLDGSPIQFGLAKIAAIDRIRGVSRIIDFGGLNQKVTRLSSLHLRLPPEPGSVKQLLAPLLHFLIH